MKYRLRFYTVHLFFLITIRVFRLIILFSLCILLFFFSFSFFLNTRFVLVITENK